MIELLTLTAVTVVVAYPFVGAVMYEDPWGWPLKKGAAE